MSADGGSEMVSVERLGDEIATLAAHLAAATCRWLQLVAEFDEREGWGEQGCRSCAEWLGWRCSIGPVAAREHVRVARRLRDLPLVRAAFSSGELSYSKVRALARVERVDREEDLLALARTTTAAQLERTVRAFRGVARDEADGAHRRRHLTLIQEADGSVRIAGRLAREEAAVLERALDLARDALRDDGAGGDSAESPPQATSADALVALADAFLARGDGGAAVARPAPERFQVLVHVDAAALAAGERTDAQRCSTADGEPLAAETVQRLCCDGAVVPILHRSGRPPDVGRRTRTVPPALRRALHARDDGCRFPGCPRRRHLHAHHIEHWARGGPTDLDNLVHLCTHHHRLVHEGGFGVERRPGGRLRFADPHGRTIDALPRPAPGDPAAVPAEHDRRGIHPGPGTATPDWYGDRLDLGRAVDALLACSA